MALRPRESPSSMASRCTAHELADCSGADASAAGATPKSVVTAMAGFAWVGSAPTPVATSTVAAPMGPPASGWASRTSADVANSAPESVITPLAGFAGGGPASAPVAVADGRSPTGSLAGLADTHAPISLATVRRPQPLSDRRPPFPGGRPWSSQCAAATIPAAPARLRVVSFARSRRCSHRRRVIALTSELTSWFSGLSLAGFEVTLYGRFWVTPEAYSLVIKEKNGLARVFNNII